MLLCACSHGCHPKCHETRFKGSGGRKSGIAVQQFLVSNYTSSFRNSTYHLHPTIFTSTWTVFMVHLLAIDIYRYCVKYHIPHDQCINDEKRRGYLSSAAPRQTFKECVHHDLAKFCMGFLPASLVGSPLSHYYTNSRPINGQPGSIAPISCSLFILSYIILDQIRNHHHHLFHTLSIPLSQSASAVFQPFTSTPQRAFGILKSLVPGWRSQRDVTAIFNSSSQRSDYTRSAAISRLKQGKRYLQTHGARALRGFLAVSTLAGYVYFHSIIYFQLLGFRESGIADFPVWGFGQVIAITVWVPPAVEFVYLEFRKFPSD
jgi:hypothetical protein